MTLSPVAARLLADAAASGRPNAHLLPIAEARANLTGFYAAYAKPEIAGISEIEFASGEATIRARLYRPTDDLAVPLIVFFHGGGWLLGSVDDYDLVARKLALATGFPLLSVEYRRAPENPFPAAVDDALAAVRWVAASANEIGCDATRLVVAGDSAGGNLATVTALRCRDEGGPTLVHQLLIYPVTTCDLSVGFDDRYDGMILQRDELLWHQQHYLHDPDDRANPHVSPLGADLRGLPSATVVLAECDPIEPQGRRYAEALAAAGVSVEVLKFDGMIHGFFGLGEVFPEAVDALRLAGAAIRRATAHDNQVR